jgi:hypothetical protein
VLSHRDVILNRIIWSTTSSQLSHRGERYTHHMGTPNHWGTTQLSQRRTMPQPLGDDSTLTQRRTMPHHVGMPNTGLPLRSTQLSHRGERILEDVSRRCNHQHSVLLKSRKDSILGLQEVNPSLSRVVINEDHIVQVSTQGSNSHGSTNICNVSSPRSPWIYCHYSERTP